MVHESLLVVTARGESIGKVICQDGNDTFLVEGEEEIPRDVDLCNESTTGIHEEGSLLFTLTEYEEEEEKETPASESPPHRP